VAFGAVGFIDGAQDTPQHRRQATNKFKEDLKSALHHVPDLDVFIFFTNVDLTPNNQTDLWAFARGLKHAIHVELFAREQIRLVLNTPQGFGLRLQYLDIEMSKDEQASLFSAHGEEIQATLARRFTNMDAAMARIEFFADNPAL